MVGIITVLLIIYIIIISWILYFRISKLHKKRTGENINFMMAGLNVFIAILANEYKEDKLYNNLVWQLRILMPITIVLAIILGSL